MGSSQQQLLQRKGKSVAGKAAAAATAAAEKVVVAVKAATREISKTAIVWALTHVVQPGGSIILLVVIPAHSSGIASFPCIPIALCNKLLSAALCFWFWLSYLLHQDVNDNECSCARLLVHSSYNDHLIPWSSFPGVVNVSPVLQLSENICTLLHFRQKVLGLSAVRRRLCKWP